MYTSQKQKYLRCTCSFQFVSLPCPLCQLEKSWKNKVWWKVGENQVVNEYYRHYNFQSLKSVLTEWHKGACLLFKLIHWWVNHPWYLFFLQMCSITCKSTCKSKGVAQELENALLRINTCQPSKIASKQFQLLWLIYL